MHVSKEVCKYVGKLGVKKRRWSCSTMRRLTRWCPKTPKFSEIQLKCQCVFIVTSYIDCTVCSSLALARLGIRWPCNFKEMQVAKPYIKAVLLINWKIFLNKKHILEMANYCFLRPLNCDSRTKNIPKVSK